MKDIHFPLRKVFYTIITGLTYTCYENGAVPDNAQEAYVIISDISGSENSNKTGFGNDVQILIDIVTKFPKNKIVGSFLADEIAGNILNQINSKTQIAISNNLQIVNTKIIQDQKLTSKSETYRIYRRLIRFQQLIMEV